MSSQEKILVTGNCETQPATGNAEARVTSNFALQHLTAAVLFTEKCAEIERDNEGEDFGTFFVEDIRSYASGAIMSSVAGLEAYLNELFLPDKSSIKEALLIRKEKPNSVKQFFGITSALCKYQTALDILDVKEKLDEESTEFKNAKNLIALRNTLVHFKPFWGEEYQKVGSKNLQEELKDEFEMSPFAKGIFDNDSDFAANKCMSSSCCKWALQTTFNFIDKFSSLSGIPNKLTKYPNKLTEYLDIVVTECCKGTIPAR